MTVGVVCLYVVGPPEKAPPTPPLRKELPEWLWWVVLGPLILTLPVSFPALVLYNKIRKKKFHGKGAGFLFLLWVASCVVWLVVGALVDLYLRKGIGGLRTFFWVVFALLVWVAVVALVLRLFIALVVAVARIHRWWVNRSRK